MAENLSDVFKRVHNTMQVLGFFFPRHTDQFLPCCKEWARGESCDFTIYRL